MIFWTNVEFYKAIIGSNNSHISSKNSLIVCHGNEDMDEQLHPTENCEMQLFTSALISDKLLAKEAQDLMPSISLSV